MLVGWFQVLIRVRNWIVYVLDSTPEYGEPVQEATLVARNAV